MRVVFDTVILVRALIGPFSRWGSLLYERTDEYEWVVSPGIVSEHLEVIERPLLARKFRSIETRNVEVMLELLATATLVKSMNSLHICRDPEDDKFLEAAVAGGASFIVTEDNDLLDLGSFGDITICSAREFLRRLDSDFGE